MKLIKPIIDLETEFRDMLLDWELTGEKLVPFVLQYDSSDFQEYINKINGFEKGINIPEKFVPHSTFWLIDNNQIIGVVNIRYELTENTKIEGGHIGYGIRPSQRRKGYATNILKLALVEAKKLGIKRALVTCDKDNMGSIKTILNNNGVYAQENLYDGRIVQGYWIDIN